MSRSRFSLPLAALLLTALAAPSLAQAAEFVVDDPGDSHDRDPGDGLCRAMRPYRCTLRAAIEEANASPGHDVVRIPVADTYALALGQLLVTDSVSVRGEPGVVVDAGGTSRVFFIANGDVTIRDLTITGGDPGYAQGGGGIQVAGDAQVHLAGCVVEHNLANQEGAGIRNHGSLHVERTSVRDNENTQTDDAGLGLTSTGGGIYNASNAMLVVEESAIVRNRAFRGGGIASQGYLWISDSTISGNEALSAGAGILVRSPPEASHTAEADIERCTITENHLPYEDTTELVGGAGIANVMSYVRIHASIVAGNTHEDLGFHPHAPDCADFAAYLGDPSFWWLAPAEYWSASYNVMGTLDGCEAFDPADEDRLPTGSDPLDPLLGPLLPWTPGGTELHIPANGSPARLAGPRCQLPAIPNTPVPSCHDVDQRGYLRAGGELETDIGAYESNGVVPPPPRAH